MICYIPGYTTGLYNSPGYSIGLYIIVDYIMYPVVVHSGLYNLRIVFGLAGLELTCVPTITPIYPCSPKHLLEPNSVDMCRTVSSSRRSPGLSECFCNYYKSRIWFMPCNKLQQRLRTIRGYLRPQNTYKVCGPMKSGSVLAQVFGFGSGVWDLWSPPT